MSFWGAVNILFLDLGRSTYIRLVCKNLLICSLMIYAKYDMCVCDKKNSKMSPKIPGSHYMCCV